MPARICPAHQRKNIMKKLALLILAALMTVGLARAQETLTGEWDCLAVNPGPHDGVTSLTCRSICYSDTPDENGSYRRPNAISTPATYVCDSEPAFVGKYRQISYSLCQDIVISSLPVDFDGYRGVAPPIVCTPASTQSSGGGGSDGGGNKALVAGGAMIAGVALYHAFQPSLPEGLTLEPTAHVAYRDGFPASSFALRGSYGNRSVLPEGLILESTAHVAYRDGFPASSFALRGAYGNWSISAFSAHTGEQWSPLRARAQWQWVWDF